MATALQNIPVDSIGAEPASLGDYAGSVLLVVNVASKCGLTPQYEGLEAVYQRYNKDGLVVLGFPANNFGGQEPGTNEEIAEFCTPATRSPSRCSPRSASSARTSTRCTPSSRRRYRPLRARRSSARVCGVTA